MTRAALAERLARADLPGFDVSAAPPAPAGRYVAVRVAAGIAYVSGQMPRTAGGSLLVASDLDAGADLAYASARLAMANALAQVVACAHIRDVLGVVRVTGYFVGLGGMALAPALDGASDLVAEVFGGEAGAHARAVLACATLPGGAAVELVVEVECTPAFGIG